MTTIARQWIAELNTSLLKMSALVEESLRTAMAALKYRDSELPRRVEEQDTKIDALENRIRDNAVKTLALQQPVGSDLRFLVSALYMASELERIGDNSLNIAQRAQSILEQDGSDAIHFPELAEMSALAEKMLEQAINSFVKQDAAMARQVIALDPRMNGLHASVEDAFLNAMHTGSELNATRYHHVVIALNLERIGDQATNLAEEVVFLVEGRNIRHQMQGTQPELRFASSPLSGLEHHAEIVNQCLALTRTSLEKYVACDSKGFAEISLRVSQKENEADALKRNIRGHLPKGIILPIDKFELFAYLKEQDKVADEAQTLIDWLSLRECSCMDLGKTMLALFDKCFESSRLMQRMLAEAENFFRDRNDGNRNRVKKVIREIRQMEHEADALEMGLKHMVFKQTQDAVILHHQLTAIDIIGNIADHAENAADMMRAMVAR